MYLNTKYSVGDKVYVTKTLEVTKDPYDRYKQTVKKCIFISRETIVAIRLAKDSEGELITFYYTDKSSEPYEEKSIFTWEHALADFISKTLEEEDDSNEQIQEM